VSEGPPPEGQLTGTPSTDRGTVMLGRGVCRALSPSLTLLACLALPASAAAMGGTVYVTNTGSKNVAQFAIGSHDALAALTPPTIESGSSPEGVVVSPDGKSLYVANGGEATVSQYDVNPATGALSAKTPASVPSGGSFIHSGVAITPDGNSVYVTNHNENSISQYDVNPATGALSAKSPATVATGKGPLDVAVTADGKSAYVVNLEDQTVSQYDISPTTGALTAKSPAAVAAGFGVAGVAVAPNGQSAYVSGASGVWQYDINPTTGALTAKSPASVSGPVGGGTGDTTPIVVAANGKSVYASSGAAYKPEIFQYDVNPATGALSPKTPEAVSTEAQPSNLALAPDGKGLYVTITFSEKTVTEKVSLFAVRRKTGALSFRSAANPAGTEPLGIAVGRLPRKRHH
jgi:6-phosphogluconolactonase (cycloisomerase 2 family)